MSWRERRQEREKTKAYDAQHARAMREKADERVPSEEETPPEPPAEHEKENPS